MINDKDAQERTINDEREEHQRASQYFSRSLFRAGVGLALLPISMVPPEPQQHFKVAGREFAHGLAKLAYRLADELDEFAETARSPRTEKEKNVSDS